MTAAERLVALDTIDAHSLCDRAEQGLSDLVDVMNRETVLLRAGHYAQAGELSGEKTQLSQDYVTLARAIQRAALRLKVEAPERVEALRRGHERLATQMAENLRVLATARTVTETLLGDMARALGGQDTTRTYGAAGELPAQLPRTIAGLAVNRAL